MSKASGLVLDMAHQPTLGTLTLSGTDLKDFSSHQNHGTPTDITTSVLPSGLGVMSFNGTTSYVSTLLSWDIKAITINTWFWTNTTARVYMITRANSNWSTADNGTFRIDVYGSGDGDNAGKVQLYGKQGGVAGVKILSDAVFTYSAWQMVTVTWDGAKWRMYRNGVRVDDDSYANAGDFDGTSDAIWLGVVQFSAATYWVGYLSLLRIYNWPLSTAQILDRYTAEKWWFGL